MLYYIMLLHTAGNFDNEALGEETGFCSEETSTEIACLGYV